VSPGASPPQDPIPAPDPTLFNDTERLTHTLTHPLTRSLTRIHIVLPYELW